MSFSKSSATHKILAIATLIVPQSSSPFFDIGEKQCSTKKYDFTQIGEPLPKGVTLKKFIEPFPPKDS